MGRIGDWICGSFGSIPHSFKGSQKQGDAVLPVKDAVQEGAVQQQLDALLRWGSAAGGCDQCGGGRLSALLVHLELGGVEDLAQVIAVGGDRPSGKNRPDRG